MITKIVLCASVIPSILGLHHSSNSVAKPENFVPVTLTVNSVSGLNYTLEVDLAGAPDQDEVVSISTSTPTSFTSIPMYATVPAGQTCAFFTVTLNGTPPSWNVKTSADGGYVAHTWLNYCSVP